MAIDEELVAETQQYSAEELGPAIDIGLEPQPTPIVAAPVAPTTTDFAGEAPPGTSSIWWGRAAAAVWLAGMLVAFLVQARRIVRYRKITSLAAPAPQWLVDEVQRLASKMGVRAPAIGVSAAIASPLVWCASRPRLLWPESLATPAEAARYRPVIAHELAHLARRDHWTARIELVVSVAWWWNPLAWHARRRLREAAEQACDAKALEALGGGRRQYAELFLELSCLAPRSPAPAPALGVASGSRRTFEKRLKLMLTDRVSSKLSWNGLLAAAALALVALPGFSLGQGTLPAAPENEPQPPLSSTPLAELPQPPAAEPATTGPVPLGLAPVAAFPDPPAAEPATTAPVPLGVTPSDPFAQPPGVAPATEAELPRAPGLVPSTSPAPVLNPDTPAGASLPPGPTLDPQPVVPLQNPANSLEERLSRLEAAVSRLAEALEGNQAARPPSRGPGRQPAPLTSPRPATIEERPPARGAASRTGEGRQQSAPAVGGLESLDLVSLSTAYAEAIGETKIAKANLERIRGITEGEPGAINQAEVDSAEIKLETATRKLKVLEIIVRVAAENAKAELMHANQLHEKGFMSESGLTTARAKLQILEAILD
jgi:beta-lactamase regulating signal transducer with metallopeptidase domain